MRFYDISVPLSPTLVCYPGDPQIEIASVADITQGYVANVSRLTLSSHSGTHLDAPRHFFMQGAAIDALDLGWLLGPARVCAMHTTAHITADDLHPLQLAGVKRVLFHTVNSALWDVPTF